MAQCGCQRCLAVSASALEGSGDGDRLVARGGEHEIEELIEPRARGGRIREARPLVF